MFKVPSAAEIVSALGGNASGMCRCPSHDDKNASLSVREGILGKPLLHCFTGCTFEQIVAALRVRGIWPEAKTNGGARKKADARPDDAEAEEARREEEFTRWRLGIHLLRAAAIESEGPPRAYLKERGIKLRPANAYLVPKQVTARFANKNFPAMVVPICSDKGLRGAQLTFLDPDLKTKANTELPRRTFGLLKGGYVLVGSPDPAKPLLVAEGFEDALSVTQLTDLPAIATLGTENMKAVTPPASSEVIIAADRDTAGRSAAEALAKRLLGRKVRIALPPESYKDWNEALVHVSNTDALRKSLLEADAFKGGVGLALWRSSPR